ncbi:hypothetical protein CDAR_534111 [Caerostris darwini]|uniref:4Fe-4S ferredoxin-type domain-containing protein n=1 Tax=Caerostris darwini TaxID=1538125 RepID=A0AAV4SAP0_9ARAC|nr:hypothetical protein CDAR_534111 [Caerostris darwini]
MNSEKQLRREREEQTLQKTGWWVIHIPRDWSTRPGASNGPMGWPERELLKECARCGACPKNCHAQKSFFFKTLGCWGKDLLGDTNKNDTDYVDRHLLRLKADVNQSGIH